MIVSVGHNCHNCISCISYIFILITKLHDKEINITHTTYLHQIKVKNQQIPKDILYC